MKRAKTRKRPKTRHQRSGKAPARRGNLPPAAETCQALVENAPDAFVVTSAGGNIVLVNAQTEKMFGYAREELLGQPLEILLPERHRENHTGHRAGFLRAPHTRPMGTGLPLSGRRKDGSEFPVDISLRMIETGGEPLVASVVRDITERIYTERELARLAAFPARNPQPVIECDAEGRLTYTNPAAEALLYSTSPVSPQRSLEDKLFPGFFAAVKKCLTENVKVQGQESQHGLRTYLWSVHPVPEAGRAHVYATDITDRKKAEDILRTQSLLDDLTGLYNRRGFLSIGKQHWGLAQRARRQVALLFIDLDGLKMINDTLGHLAGDRVIIEAADVLRETFRGSDVIARLGGDEFAILPVYDSNEDLETLARRLQDVVERRNTANGRRFPLSLSIGGATSYPKTQETLADLLVRADANMYEKKRTKKKNRFPETRIQNHSSR